MGRYLLLSIIGLGLWVAVAHPAYSQMTGTGTGGSNSLFGNQSQGQAGARGGGGGVAGDVASSLQQNAGLLTTGNERFINRQPGEFVGADTDEVTNARSQATGRGGQGQNRIQGNQFSQFNPNQPNAQGGVASTIRRTLRVPMRIGFSSTPTVSSEVRANFQNVLARVPHLRSAGDVAVTMEGRTAILRGTIDSEHAKDLAARLARLEPGISDVRNELIVVSTGQLSPGVE